LTLFQEHFLHI